MGTAFLHQAFTVTGSNGHHVLEDMCGWRDPHIVLIDLRPTRGTF